MMSKTELMFAPDVARLIHSVRNQRIILDADLAGLYGVPTKRLNEQYRRNFDRFRRRACQRASGAKAAFPHPLPGAETSLAPPAHRRYLAVASP